jgi:hypothetical protein
MPDGVFEEGPCDMLFGVPPGKAARSSYPLSPGNSLPKWQRHGLPLAAFRGRQFRACLYIDWKYNVQFIQFFLMDLDFQSSGEMKANFIFNGFLGRLQQPLPETGVLKGPGGKVGFQLLPLGLFCHNASLLQGIVRSGRA